MGKWTLDSTIFAVATVPLPAPRAIIRISGSQTRAAMEKLFTPDVTAAFTSPRRSAVPGALHVGEQELRVRAWMWFFSGPASYTGEDLAELHIPGSAPLLRLVEQALLELGLAPAQRGEFTARALLLGKIELTQAEAINALVQAENDAQIEAALTLLKGKLHAAMTDAYDRLTDLTGRVEANIDFSEEDIEVIGFGELKARIEELRAALAALIERAIDAEVLATLPRVFLVGPANAGKSSLLNRLTGIDRAICSALPGTTRDMLCAAWRHGQQEVMLVDTAGLIAEPKDAFTARAAARTRAYLATADLYILVLDLEQSPSGQLPLVASWQLPRSRTIAVVNKRDLARARDVEGFRREVSTAFDPPAFVSALTGEGLAQLTSRVFEVLGQRCLSVAQEELALNRRQRSALQEALDALVQAGDDLETLATGASDFGYEIIAADLHRALAAGAELLGKDAAENVLDTIFSQFCIGK